MLILKSEAMGNAKDFLPDYSDIFPVNMRERSNSEDIDIKDEGIDTDMDFTLPEAMRKDEDLSHLPVGDYGGSNAFGKSIVPFNYVPTFI